jgi:hypothetical protein
MSMELLERALDELVAPAAGELGDWDDVLRRGQVSRRGVPRRFAVAAAVGVAGVVVATALATGLADRFGAWVSGTPGRPAPAGLQHGFDTRNRAVYASFPAGTKLRLLLSRSVGGVTFSLLGFRNGDAYCLRLVRTDHPDALGRNECLRAEELTGVPALVAGDVWFSVGKTRSNVNGVYGFADDSVRSLAIERLRGGDRVPVVNNVFLSLRAVRSGSVQHHALPNPVFAIRAELRGGGTKNVPYVGSGLGGVVPGGRRPTGPSYFGRPKPEAIPGPARVTAPISHPTIAWLKQHQARGLPMPRVRFAHAAFARVIQPDPDDPLRVGVAVGGRGALCTYYFAPLAPTSFGGGCGGWFRFGPLQLASWFLGPIEHLNGLAADGITHVTAFLASGRVLQAALRDNVFEVAVSATELPGRLVGYDSQNRVAGIVELPGHGVLTACPSARFVKPVGQLAAPQPWERVDLATLAVNGRQILGLSPAEVEAALGKPSGLRPAAQRTNGVGIPELRYGGKTFASAGLVISFSKKGDRIFANSLYFRSPSLVDAKLGHVLRMDPLALQHAIARTYGATYRVFLSYGSNPQIGCAAVLPGRGGPSGISLGLDPARPSQPYLVLSKNAMG